MINEDKLIQNLRAHSQGFIGDDAAVLPHIDEGRYVIAKDLLIEDVHFRTRYFTPHDLAHKALQVNLSDLAAMGARPLYILGGISIPDNLQDYARDFLDSLIICCQEANTILIGGDTTTSPTQLFISITAIGQASVGHIKYRHTAQSDDLICVAGNLGWAHLGFRALEKGIDSDAKYIKSFLNPKAKIEEGQWLGQQACVTSMMDISDGLYTDLKRLCTLSHKGAVIDLDKLSRYLLPELSLEHMLEGGEDYGLLFTLSQDAWHDVSGAFTDRFHDELKVIGNITNHPEVVLQKEGRITDLRLRPFTHFGE